MSEVTELQPDFALLRRRRDSHTSAHPSPSDVFLVIEVVDTTADIARRVKVPLYARAGVPETWLVDVQKETVTLHRDPTASGYRSAKVVRRGHHIAPAAFPDCPLAVDDILG